MPRSTPSPKHTQPPVQPQRATPNHGDDLPQPFTIFLTASQRRTVTATLRRFTTTPHINRAQALLALCNAISATVPS